MAETPRGGIGGALKDTVSGRTEAPVEASPADALMFYNRSRASIVQALILEPALSASKVSSRSGVDPSSTVWHLHRLAVAEIVERLDDDAGAFYTPRGLVQDRGALADLRVCYCAGCAELLALAAEQPGLDIVHAARSLEASRGTVSRIVDKLASRRLAAARRDGARRRIFLTDRLAELADASRRWYRDYTPVLTARLKSEGLEVRTDVATDRSLRLEYKAGGAVTVITVPHRILI